MSDVEQLEDHLPHMFFEAMCIACRHRWIAVTRTNVLLKRLECPECREFGNVINTGQCVDD